MSLAYYRAAVAALRYLDAREAKPRRFGPDADARFNAFVTAPQDRLDILIRDADAEYGRAFGPAMVFRRLYVSRDDAFGPVRDADDPTGFLPVRGSAAADLLRRHDAAPSLRAACVGIAEAWGEAVMNVDVPNPTPNSRHLVCGRSAIVALAEQFDGRSELDWSAQVVVVASEPCERQIAGFVAGALGARRGTTFTSAPDEARASDPDVTLNGHSVLVSGDACASDAAHARLLSA